jgi:hypothetical protein
VVSSLDTVSPAPLTACVVCAGAESLELVVALYTTGHAEEVGRMRLCRGCFLVLKQATTLKLNLSPDRAPVGVLLPCRLCGKSSTWPASVLLRYRPEGRPSADHHLDRVWLCAPCFMGAIRFGTVGFRLYAHYPGFQAEVVEFGRPRDTGGRVTA